MKIICLQENLKNGLNAAERIIGKSLTLPILNNLLLKAEKGRLRISSTNLEIGINYWISGKIEKDGEITVPAKVLSSIVNNLPNKKIELEAKDNTLNLKCENYKAKIKGQDAKDFPIIPKIQSQTTCSVGQEALRAGLSQVAGMAALSESRPEISGILFDFSKNVLKLVATDSFRLGEKTIFTENSFQAAVIVPQRTALELIRILSEKMELEEKKATVNLVLSPSQVMFDLGHVQLISRLIDGQYPPYQQIIPTNFQASAIVEREEVLKTVKIASLFSSKINDIQLIVSPAKKIIEIFAQSADVGENRSQLKAESEGKQLEVVFNWRYILDGLNNINSNKILFKLNNETSPTVIKPVGDESYLYVVMPIKSA